MPPEDPEDAGSPRASSPEVVGQVMDQILEEVLRREGAAEVMDSTATTVAVEEDFDDCPLRLKRVRAPSKKKAEADEAEEMLRRALQGEKDEDVVVVPHCRDCKRDLEGPEALRVPPPKRCRDCRRKRKIAFTPRNKRQLWIRLEPGLRRRVQRHLARTSKNWRVVLDRGAADRHLRRMQLEKEKAEADRKRRMMKKSNSVEIIDDDVEIIEIDLDDDPTPSPSSSSQSSEESGWASGRDPQPKSRCVRFEAAPAPAPVVKREVAPVAPAPPVVKREVVSRSLPPPPVSVLKTDCSLCDEKFNKTVEFCKHLELEFREPLRRFVKNLASPLAKCIRCPELLAGCGEYDLLVHFNSKHRLPWAMNHQLLLDFRNMQKIKMEDGKPGFLCGECQKCFPTKTAFRSHERYMHGSLQNELLNVLRQTPKDGKCLICLSVVNGMFSVHLMGHFKRMLRSMLDVESCPICEEPHEPGKDMARHIGVDHGEALLCYNDVLLFREGCAFPLIKKPQPSLIAQNLGSSETKLAVAPEKQQPSLKKSAGSSPSQTVVPVKQTSLLKKSSSVTMPDEEPVQAIPKVPSSEAKPNPSEVGSKPVPASAAVSVLKTERSLPVFQCNLCSEGSFTSEVELRIHLTDSHFSHLRGTSLDSLLTTLRLREMLKPVTSSTSASARSIESTASKETQEKQPVKREKRRLSKRFCKSFSRQKWCFVQGCQYKERENSVRKEDLLVHMHRRHFGNDMLKDVLKRLRSPGVAACPSCKEDCGSFEELAEHWAVNHRRVLFSCEKAWEERVTVAVSRVGGGRRGSRDDGIEEASNDDGSKREREAERQAQLNRAKRELKYWSEGAGKNKTFIQRHPCHLVEDLQSCRECSKVRSGQQRADETVCQFEGFRKLVLKFGRFQKDGFLCPDSDPTEVDKELWLALPEVALRCHERLDEQTALFILDNVASEFCKLVGQEEQAELDYFELPGCEDLRPIWKKLEEQVREMCDVCSTTIFNVHFTCPYCCVLVCLDCFQTRLSGRTEYKSSKGASAASTYKSQRRRRLAPESLDKHMWPFCHRDRTHLPEALRLTKIIPDDAHVLLRDQLHETMRRRGRELTCGCEAAREKEERSAVAGVVGDLVNKVDTLLPKAPVRIEAPAEIAQESPKESPSPKAKKTYLKVDDEVACRVCEMDFLLHQMDSAWQKRSHILSHFRKQISDSIPTEADEEGFLKCPEPNCGVTMKKSKMTDTHLAVAHGYLDRLYCGEDESAKVSPKVEVMETEASSQSPKENNAVSNGTDVKEEKEDRPEELRARTDGIICKTPTTTCSKKKISLGEYRKRKSPPEMTEILASKRPNESEGFECPLGCRERVTTDKAKHLVTHFWMNATKSAYDRNLRTCDHCDDALEGTVDSYLLHLQKHMRDSVKTFLTDKSASISIFTSREEERSVVSASRAALEGNWCCICEAKENRLKSHYLELQKLKRGITAGSTGKSVQCDQCENLPFYENSADYIVHYIRDHLTTDFRQWKRKLAEDGDFRAIERHRKSLGISVKNAASPSKRSGNKTDCNGCDGRGTKRQRTEHEQPPHGKDQGSGGDQSSFDLDSLFKRVQVVRNAKDPRSRPGTLFQCQVKNCFLGISEEAKARKHAKEHAMAVSRLSTAAAVAAGGRCPMCEFRAPSHLNLTKELATHYTRKHLKPEEVISDGLADFSREAAAVPARQRQAAAAAGESAIKVKEQYIIRKQPKERRALKDLLNENFGKVELVMEGGEQVNTEAAEEEEERRVWSRPPVGEERVWLTSGTRREYFARHEWLCDGKLLLLEDPRDQHNEIIFKDQWIRGQPAVIANSSDLLNTDLWHPRSFLRDFGHLRHPLINCLSGRTVPNARMADFWRGFGRVVDRLRDVEGNPMVLKLKDWPPNDDIAEYMPERFSNLINSFPMPEYTLRQGLLNLASYLPDCYLKPELGPKMYIAYGSALHDNKASTNLHIDMSDAVNLLVHVGIPEDTNRADNEELVYRDIDIAGCDISMKMRARRSAASSKLPGALWHIYHPRDTPTIRTFLKRVAIEKGRRLDPHDDPIHDQSTYLDRPLRERLCRDHGVAGYAIVQCMGDTVFIPAGACHQVRNLHNCVKVAEDFVSPENVSHCIHLTQEFRHLTEWHTNHEDKLQVKSILYHAVKTALARLNRDSHGNGQRLAD